MFTPSLLSTVLRRSHPLLSLSSSSLSSSTSATTTTTAAAAKPPPQFLRSLRSLSTTPDDDASLSSSSPSIWDPPNLDHIFDRNRNWVTSKTAVDKNYFKNLNKGQQPEYLLIGCADSRVGAQEIMGLDQGELFIHRNIANLVINSDLNVLSTIYYAVNVLKVKDIFVMGHYNCGGVRAAGDNKDLGLIEHWLRNIRDVARLHNEELGAIADPEERHRRLVELNVQEQCVNLFGNSIIQKAQSRTGRPRIHGLVYDISTGYLKHLDIDFRKVLKKYRKIYSVADFQKYSPVALSDVKVDDEGVEGEGTAPWVPAEGSSSFKSIPDLAVPGSGSKFHNLTAEETRYIFDELDGTGKGWIGKSELADAMKRFGMDAKEAELDAMFSLVAGEQQDEHAFVKIDLKTFDRLLRLLTKKDDDVLVVVAAVGGQARPFKCNNADTIGDIKKALCTVTSVPYEQTELVHNGKVMEDDKTLASYGLDSFAEFEQRIIMTPDNFMRKKK
jgi:carbonic anhydrase